MAWAVIEALQRWSGKRKDLLTGLVGVAIEGVAGCIPGGGLAVKVLQEVARYGTNRLLDPKAEVAEIKAAGQTVPAEQLEEINAWLETLTRSYAGILDRLEKVARIPENTAATELTLLVKRVLQERTDLARDFDACVKQVRGMTLSLRRVEEKLDHYFHEFRRVSLSLEEIKSVFVEGPMASDWAQLRQARPDALQAVIQADEHFLAGRRDEGIAVLVGLLQKRGAGSATLSRQLGLAYLGKGSLADARACFEKAGCEQPASGHIRTLNNLNTAASRAGKVEVWRSLPRGIVVDRRYRIEAEVGRGGMASVYRAVGVDRINRGQVVALKVPAPGLMADERTRDRFVQEIEIARRLSAGGHPGIVPTLGYVLFDDPHSGRELYGLVLEFVAGMSLADVLAQRRARRQPLRPGEILGILETVCLALDFAHNQKPPVFHRDVKPHNIMITPQGAARLMDFGIARVLTDAPGRLSVVGEVVGTPIYMSPEFHDPNAPVDARSDVYLVGNLLLEMMTFNPMGDPENRADCPPGWVALVDESMSRIRSRRPRSVKEFLERLKKSPLPPPLLPKGVSPQLAAAGAIPKQSPASPAALPSAVTCPRCHRPAMVGATYCPHCGSLMASIAVLPPPPPSLPPTPPASSVNKTAAGRCPACGSDMPAGAVACMDCGFLIQAEIGGGEAEGAPNLCPNPACGINNPPGERNCQRCGTVLPTSPGTILHGRYRIEKLLAMGGFAAIYLATDTRNCNRRVVIKDMICADPQEFAIRLNFFRREAEFLRSLERIPTVARVYDLIEQGQMAHLVLEYIPGQDLLKLMESNGNRPFPLDRVIEWGIALCDLLDIMHTSDPPIVWRDVKPDNIMLLEDRRSIKFIDFGTARDLGRTMKERRAAKTRVYTEGYAPPEQIVGRPEPRSDLFAAAATLYHLATGKAPEGFYTERSLRTELAASHGSIPSRDRWFYEILAINLSEDVNDRYFSAREIKTDLERRQVTREVTCPACGVTNKVREPFCRRCSEPLTPLLPPCDHCGKDNYMGSRLCLNCGNRLR